MVCRNDEYYIPSLTKNLWKLQFRPLTIYLLFNTWKSNLFINIFKNNIISVIVERWICKDGATKTINTNWLSILMHGLSSVFHQLCKSINISLTWIIFIFTVLIQKSAHIITWDGQRVCIIIGLYRTYIHQSHSLHQLGRVCINACDY